MEDVVMGNGINSFYFVGVDLGQVNDYTAIAVVERREEAGEFDWVRRAHRKVVSRWFRYLERVPLGTTYPDVVRRIVRLTTSPQLFERCCLTVDATGVGRSVLDLLREMRPQCSIVPVVFTSGEQETYAKGVYGVPKKDLVGEVVVMLQTGELSICEDLPNAKLLVEEMMNIRARIRATGYTEYGAQGPGKHDDMVMALALSCWALRRASAGELTGDEAYVIDLNWDDKVRRFRKHVEWLFGG
jgi:hypothetical protein